VKPATAQTKAARDEDCISRGRHAGAHDDELGIPLACSACRCGDEQGDRRDDGDRASDNPVTVRNTRRSGPCRQVEFAKGR
jgi:hypothetical protein